MMEFHIAKTTVAGIITRKVDDEIEVLLIRRGSPPYEDHYCLPGGHIDKNEPAIEAVIREVKEETGLEFEAKFFGYFDEIIPEENIHAVVLVFDGNASGELQAQPGEVSDIRWLNQEEIQSQHLAFQHNEILEKYFSQISKQ